MINPQIISLPHDVEDELSLLNILREDLIEAGRRGYAEWTNATLNDPPGTAGNNAYKGTVRAIRDLLIPKQWKRQDKDNIPFTTNAELKIAIVVSSGTQDVGILEGKPRTRNPKGEKTKAYVSSFA